MKKTALIILDGWGIGDGSKSDAIAQARTPFISGLYKKYPHSTLRTSGEDVGLPHGQMGNSEVGHLNIGAGRVVYQDLAKINKAVREGTIDRNPVVMAAFRYCIEHNKPLHLIGLVSEGGVHSSQSHLHHLCDLAKASGVKKVFVHAFTDGRDTDPKSGLTYIRSLQEHCRASGAELASVIGRYYAMDRDKRWERVRLAYDLLTKGAGERTADVLASIQSSYDSGITDEFIKPLALIDGDGNPKGVIHEGDAVFCFNFRTDRCREITEVLTQINLPEHGMTTIPLYYITMTNYDHTFRSVHVVYDKEDLKMTLGEALEHAGKRQIRIAETEKYPHVTFFFSGGREKEFEGERRIMVPSPKVATYDLQPEMSARELTDAVLPELLGSTADFVCINFANADMVGHTGVFPAVVKAVETVDECTKRIIEAGLRTGYSFIIIADHGNSDYMINPDGSPNTAHTTNPVPCIVIDEDVHAVKEGTLADIAPTILYMMGIKAPSEMTGKVLVS